MGAYRLPKAELIHTPVEFSVVYEVRYAISSDALLLPLQDLKALLEQKLPIRIRYIGPSPADPANLFSVIFVAFDYPPPSSELTPEENQSVAYLTFLLGREITHHCRQGIVPTVSYRADVWVHPSDSSPEPVTEPPPPLIPLPQLPDLGPVLDVFKWLGIGAAGLLGARYFGITGAVFGGLAGLLLLRPTQVHDFGRMLQEDAGLFLAAGVGAALVFSGRRTQRARG